MDWTIHPLRLGSMKLRKAQEVYMTGFDEIIEVPIIAWYLTDGKHRVLVDAGIDDFDHATRNHFAISQHKGEELLTVLAQHSIDPNSIETVFLTHLHWDHCLGCRLIPKAKIFAQKAEIEYAKNPLPCNLRAYERDLSDFIGTPWADRLCALEGDGELLPGLNYLFTPGHTVGSQSLLVRTNEGPVALVGDAVSFLESWNADPKKLPGQFYSTFACYETYAKIEALNALILPGHEAECLKRTYG